MNWKKEAIEQLIQELEFEPSSMKLIDTVVNEKCRVHLAIFNEPFLSLLMNGIKTIESRFSINRIAPFNKISKGDIILIKESGKNVTGLFIAGRVTFYSNLNKTLFDKIESEFGEQICTQYSKEFWNQRSKANFATLIEIKKVIMINPIILKKRDRSGWSILRDITKSDQLSIAINEFAIQ